jgi:hypothetical protein
MEWLPYSGLRGKAAFNHERKSLLNQRYYFGGFFWMVGLPFAFKRVDLKGDP